jgi:Ca-activated chloride channel homolog
MKYRYTQFDERLLAVAREKQLQQLFLELLMQTGGNVEDALEWLDEIARRHGLWPEGMDVDRFREQLADDGYISADAPPQKRARAEARPGGYKPTRKAEKAIRSSAFEDLFRDLRQDSLGGEHATPYAGAGGERLPEVRPWTFGDRVQDINTVETVRNALAHHGADVFDMTEEDLAVHEIEHATSCATVLALDISHSMILYGEDRITPAKKVALALTELIQTRYRKDALDVILFGDDAFPVDVRELPFVNVGPYHTNTQAALRLAQRILSRRKHANKQVVMITDGKPSAMWDGGELYINSFGLDARIVNATVEEAQACRRHGIVITTFMITSDPYLKQFVERMTQANKGRAYYADLDHLGRFVMTDFLNNRRGEVG